MKTWRSWQCDTKNGMQAVNIPRPDVMRMQQKLRSGDDQAAPPRLQRPAQTQFGVRILACFWPLVLVFLAAPTAAQVTFTDNFGTACNYLTNGVQGTIWDGLYLGAGEISGATGVGAAPGTVSIADAGISGSGLLTLASLHTDWENAADDGFYLYKVVTGNFDMSVRIATPLDTNAYNFPGLMVRAFGPGGAPAPNAAENSLLWGRFNQFSIANMSKNNVNGARTDTARGTYPNTNYWLRLTRAGNTFTLHEKATQGGTWNSVGTLTRADLAGVALQVGIEQAVFGGGATRTARYGNFSLTVSNLVSGTTPSPATSLAVAPLPDGATALSWAPGGGSTGSVVVLWTGSPVLKQAPAAGVTYTGNPNFGSGTTLPAANYFVVYSGPGNSVTVTNLVPGTTYHAAVFASAGSGTSLRYTHTPARASFVAEFLPQGPLQVSADLEGTNAVVSFNPTPGKWYRVQFTDSLNPPEWHDIDPVAQLAAGPAMAWVHKSEALAPQRFYRVQQFEFPPAGANLSPEATTATSYVSPWENLNALNDGYDPINSSDHSHGGYGNWPQTGTQWVDYDWSLPITTSMIDVYWWSDGGGILAPSACRLSYWNGTSFVPVSNATGLGVALNRFNTTTFSPVTTTRLRLEFDSGAASTGILEWRVYDAGNSPTKWPGAPESSLFAVRASSGAITSLKRKQDTFITEYLKGGSRLGDVRLKYRQSGTNWLAAETSALAATGAGASGWNPNSTAYTAAYRFTNSTTPMLAVQSAFDFADDNAITWTLSLTNLTAQPLEVGDLALPLPMNTTFAGASSSVFKHSFISGYGSFLFWMRPNSVGPYLVLTPSGQTHLEFWDTLASGGVYEAYIHSAAAGAIAAAQGTRWRQTNTSVTLPPGGSQSYPLKFRWAPDYDGVRNLLMEEGQIDVHVVPGMTVPTNLSARIALRTTQTINAVEAEFPAATQLQFLGTNGAYQFYEVQFTRLGENKLTVRYGAGKYTVLEFFVTEPLETLIQKRAAFIAGHQVANPAKWYDGLLCDWNMSNGVQPTPDNYDLITGWRIYAVTCDDPGLSKPAYLAAKNAVYPVQSEVTAMDYYLANFVWGGLQRTANETYAYGVYGIPDWYSNRNSSDTGTGGQLHIWRIYDYPHVIQMYFGLYRVAKNHPEITTALTASEYLQRAYGTAVGLFTIPVTVVGWSAYGTGLMNERIIVELIDELDANGLSAEAATLRGHWVQKVKNFVNNPSVDLFGSEYAFDSTGFETTHELAKYALRYADPPGQTNSGMPLTNAVQFLQKQMAANLVCRGTLEPAYYYLGSDYRATAGDEYVLTYMSQMGGWGVLDYGLHYATNPGPYLRLGYASYLSAWALMNTGTPESNYGYWYPGVANDGGAGGGFEAAPTGNTWLGQPHHRGSWYYASEIDLGYCGALRMAATVLADDDVFGRFCYGGTWQQAGGTNHVVPLDGVRRRLHAALSTGNVSIELANNRFASGQSIRLNDALSLLAFSIETGNPASHQTKLRFLAPVRGAYAFTGIHGTLTTLNLSAGEETSVSLPMDAGVPVQAFVIQRNP